LWVPYLLICRPVDRERGKATRTPPTKSSNSNFVKGAGRRPAHPGCPPIRLASTRPVRFVGAPLVVAPWALDISSQKGGISAPTGRRIPAQGATCGMENGKWRMENGANTRAAPATHTSRVETIPPGCRLLLIASTRAVLVVRVTIVVTAFSILHSPFSILFYAVSLRDTGNVQRSTRDKTCAPCPGLIRI
jgi:hypothetical protein